jgi:hypothetical protein
MARARCVATPADRAHAPHRRRRALDPGLPSSTRSSTDAAMIQAVRHRPESGDALAGAPLRRLGQHGTVDIRRDYLDDTRMALPRAAFARLRAVGRGFRPWLARLLPAPALVEEPGVAALGQPAARLREVAAAQERHRRPGRRQRRRMVGLQHQRLAPVPPPAPRSGAPWPARARPTAGTRRARRGGHLGQQAVGERLPALLRMAAGWPSSTVRLALSSSTPCRAQCTATRGGRGRRRSPAP